MTWAVLALQVQIPSHHVAYLYDEYTCLAKNSHGSSSDTVHLIEACKSLTLYYSQRLIGPFKARVGDLVACRLRNVVMEITNEEENVHLYRTIALAATIVESVKPRSVYLSFCLSFF